MKDVPEDYTFIPDDPSFILGVDPGKATGLALYGTQAKAFLLQWSGSSDDAMDYCYDFIPKYTSTKILVACERFDISVGTAKLGRTAVNWSIEQAGVLRHLCRRHSAGFVLQDRATPKHMAPDARLREVGWYQKGPDHVNDATRHVVLALARQYKVPPPWVQ